MRGLVLIGSFLVVLLLSVIALNHVNDALANITSGKNSSKILAKVNGMKISQSDLDRTIQILTSSKNFTVFKKDSLGNEILNQLINQELVRQASERSSIKEWKKVKKIIKEAKQDILSKYFLQIEIRKVISEETILNEYNVYVRMLGEDRNRTQPDILSRLRPKLESRLTEKVILNIFKRLREQGNVELINNAFKKNI